MPTIQGPITIRKGEEVPQELLSAAPIKVPFSGNSIVVTTPPDASFIDKDGNEVIVTQEGPA